MPPKGVYYPLLEKNTAEKEINHMSRTLGTVVRGVRAPIFREGDDVVAITADTVANALSEEGIQPRDRDIVAITESVVARCQGNYASVQQIAADVKAKTGGKTVGVSFPSSAATASPCFSRASPPAPKRSFSCSACPPTRWATIWSAWSSWTRPA